MALMTIDQSRLELVFFEALAVGDQSALQGFLDRACAGEPTLRKRVEALLAAHAAPENMLRLPEPADVPDQFVSLTEGSGATIGRYRLVEQIGEGGCGVVFMAEQEQPVRRQVALKIIKLGMDTHEVIARFEAERQALAMMDHPN